MNTITFDETYSLLSKAVAVLWTEFGFLTYPLLCDEEVEGGKDLFLELETTDDDGVVWQSKFYSEDNQSVKVEGNRLILVDDTKAEVEVTLLVPLPLNLLV